MRRCQGEIPGSCPLRDVVRKPRSYLRYWVGSIICAWSVGFPQRLCPAEKSTRQSLQGNRREIQADGRSQLFAEDSQVRLLQIDDPRSNRTRKCIVCHLAELRLNRTARIAGAGRSTYPRQPSPPRAAARSLRTHDIIYGEGLRRRPTY